MKCSDCVPAILIGLLSFQAAEAQTSAPTILRQAGFGGTSSDVPYQLRAMPDGGLVLGGESASTNGTRTSPAFGAKDFWLLRLDPSGAVAWDRSYGGAGDDQLFALQIVRSNRMILAGGSSSPVSGNKTSPNYGLRDFWVVLVNESGQPIWERSFGGSNDDFATSAAQTEDGGFVVAGYSRSGADGNKSAPCRGEGDFWVVRLDANGTKLWDQSYGGAGDDGAFSLVSLAGGSVVVAGSSASEPGGNKRGPNYGSYDVWLLRLDTGGDIEWEQVHGGDSDDGYYSVSLARTPEGGFIVGADSYSAASGNKTSSNFGQDDFWILRLNPSGDRLWETHCGGMDNDYLTSLLVTADGGCLAGGGSNSGVSGNKTVPGQSSTDFWLVKLDPDGRLQWDKTVGGTDADAFMALSLAQTTNGTLFCCGDSVSGVEGDKTVPSFGAADFWLVTLAASSSPPDLQIRLKGDVPTVLLFGELGKTYVTEASDDLQAWNPVATNYWTGTTAVVEDPGQAGHSRRFYRARSAE